MAAQRVTLIVTKRKQDILSFSRKMQSHPFKVIYAPVTLIEPIKNIRIPNLDPFHGLIFTSMNAIKYFFKLVQPDSVEIPCYVFSHRAKAQLRKKGITNIINTKADTAESFLSILEERHAIQKNFLFVKGTISRKVIPNYINQHGGFCNSVSVYKNIKHTPKNFNEVLKHLSNTSNHQKIAMVFFSSSAVKNLKDLLQSSNHLHKKLISKMSLCAIGKTTAGSIYQLLGKKADVVCLKPDRDLFANTIIEYLCSHV